MEFIPSFILDYWSLAYKEFLYISNGVLFKKEYPFNLHWFFSSAMVALLYFAYKSYKSKTYPKRIRSFILSKRYRKEFFKDCLYFSLRILYKPVYFGFLFLNISNITNFFTTHAGFSYFRFDQPVVMLDPVYGIYVYALIQLLYIDFTNFVAHYLEHKVPWIWYFHMTHHRATVLSPITKSRTHPVAYIIGFVNIAILQIPGLLMLSTAFNISRSSETKLTILFITYFIFSFIQHVRHSHIRINYGPYLSYILTSPHMHQVHHSRNPIHFNKNFGVIFAIWDVIFGSHYIPERKERYKFGINDHEGRMPKSYFFDLFHPFGLLKKDILKFFNNFKPKEKLILNPSVNLIHQGFSKLDKSETLNTIDKPTEVLKTKNLRSAGFSLAELMVTTAIASIIFLSGAMLSVNMTTMGLKQTKISEAEQDLERLVYTWKMLAAQAVNVRYTNLTSLNGRQSSADGAGFVKTFNYTTDASMGTLNGDTLMFFARDTQITTANPESLQSQFRPTGVFFMRKNDVFNVNRRGSRIVIDLGASNASGIVSPNNTDLVFNNISDVIIDQPQFSRNNILNSIRVQVTSIYPAMGNQIGFDCLGPTGDITAGNICAAGTTNAFKTITKIFTLKFPNNKRDTVLSVGEFENGVYMFRPVYGN